MKLWPSKKIINSWPRFQFCSYMMIYFALLWRTTCFMICFTLNGTIHSVLKQIFKKKQTIEVSQWKGHTTWIPRGCSNHGNSFARCDICDIKDFSSISMSQRTLTRLHLHWRTMNGPEILMWWGHTTSDAGQQETVHLLSTQYWALHYYIRAQCMSTEFRTGHPKLHSQATINMISVS